MLIFAVIIIFLLLLVSPHGLFKTENTPPISGTQVLLNPELTDNHRWWKADGGWSSSNFYPTNAKSYYIDDRVTLSQSGYLPSFYAVAISQGAGPTEFHWASRQVPYVSVNSSFRNIVSWRGSMDYSYVAPTGCLGMGIDFWFDAELQNGTLAPVELYVFFYMEGVYTLPVDSFKSVLRSDYNYSGKTMGLPWDYMYFHPFQDEKNVIMEHSFELYDYITIFKQNKPVYAQSSFILTRVDGCMELFMGEGTFTVDYVGLTQTPK